MTKQNKKPIETTEAKPAEAFEASPKTTAEPAPKITKKALVEQLLTSDKGATIEELSKQTGLASPHRAGASLHPQKSRR